jgi:hypothetical protein
MFILEHSSSFLQVDNGVMFFAHDLKSLSHCSEDGTRVARALAAVFEDITIFNIG